MSCHTALPIFLTGSPSMSNFLYTYRPWSSTSASTTSRLIEGIIQSAENNGIAIHGGSVSAMFGFFLCDGPVRNFDEAKTNNAELFGKLHREMLKRGIYLAPSPFEAGFTSLAHSDEEIDQTIEAFDQSFLSIKN